MKHLIITFIFIFFCSLGYAKETSNKTETNKKSRIEYKIIKNDNGFDTCYARFCWNESETRRICTEWFEIPCDTEVYPEATIEKN